MASEVACRPANRQDIDRMYSWRNDPEIYRWFRLQDGRLDWHSHVAWFQNRPEEREDLIIELRGRPVGVVSLAEDGDVGIYIGEKRLWGRGIATVALEAALKAAPQRDFTAEIHIDNKGSQKLFEIVGFEKVGQAGDWLQYERVWPR